MTGPRGMRALQALLTAIGVVAVAAGLFAVVTGIGGMPGDHPASPSVDSELRFFAVFWMAYGVVAIRVAPRAHLQTTAVRGLALALFVAGIARAISWLDVGRPDSLYLVLLALELGLPPLLVAWQARLAATPGPGVRQ